MLIVPRPLCERGKASSTDALVKSVPPKFLSQERLIVTLATFFSVAA